MEYGYSTKPTAYRAIDVYGSWMSIWCIWCKTQAIFARSVLSSHRKHRKQHIATNGQALLVDQLREAKRKRWEVERRKDGKIKQ